MEHLAKLLKSTLMIFGMLNTVSCNQNTGSPSNQPTTQNIQGEFRVYSETELQSLGLRKEDFEKTGALGHFHPRATLGYRPFQKSLIQSSHHQTVETDTTQTVVEASETRLKIDSSYAVRMGHDINSSGQASYECVVGPHGTECHIIGTRDTHQPSEMFSSCWVVDSLRMDPRSHVPEKFFGTYQLPTGETLTTATRTLETIHGQIKCGSDAKDLGPGIETRVTVRSKELPETVNFDHGVLAVLVTDSQIYTEGGVFVQHTTSARQR